MSQILLRILIIGMIIASLFIIHIRNRMEDRRMAKIQSSEKAD